jgi:hypothetical protein
MIKVYKKNNSIFVDDTIAKLSYSSTIGMCQIVKFKSDPNMFIFLDFKGLSSIERHLSNIKKEDGSSYSQIEWETFYTSLFQGSDVLTNIESKVLTDDQLRATAVPISPRPNTTGANGTTPYKLISLATTNANVVKSSGGNLYSIVAIGLTSTVRYLKLYNKATAPIVGTDVPVMTIPIPANLQGAGIAIPFTIGVNFPLGISLAITATVADNGSTAVGAGDVIINLTYA